MRKIKLGTPAKEQGLLVVLMLLPDGFFCRRILSPPLLRGSILHVVPYLLDHGVHAGAGRDHDDVMVRRRWCELPDEEGALQLNHRVVGILDVKMADTLVVESRLYHGGGMLFVACKVMFAFNYAENPGIEGSANQSYTRPWVSTKVDIYSVFKVGL